MLRTDVCIIGAGPAGATLSHYLSAAKVDHVLLDKSRFPRDKVCGDGITVDVMNTLKRLDPEMLHKFISNSDLLPSWGFCFRSSNGKELRYDFRDAGFPYAPFFTSKRLHLDNFLVEQINARHCHLLQETKVIGIEKNDDGFRVKVQSADGESEIQCRLLIGAEGEKPVVTKNLGLDHFREKDHLIGALRVYHKNVKGFNSGNHLEFFFDKKLLPGYFWVFPLKDGEANVGLGMVSSAISAKKFNLRKVFYELKETHPILREMFADAEAMEDPKGWGLPIVTPKRKIAGEGYALIGDAAGMIEPFTGKGIGPGMVSGRLCSQHIEYALKRKDYNLMPYHHHMYRYYANEIKVGYTLQKSLRYPAVLNSVIGVSNLSIIKNWSRDKMVDEWKAWM